MGSYEFLEVPYNHMDIEKQAIASHSVLLYRLIIIIKR